MTTNQRWHNLWHSIGATSDPEPVWECLVQAYTQPQRAYHSLNHIEDCLAKLDWAHSIAERPDLLEVAIWFHDVVYDTHKQDNEAQSAAWAVRELRAGHVSPEIADAVEKLILVTQHQRPPARTDESLLLDIDLSIFGEAPAVFDRYEMLIRQEYAWVPKMAYCEARAGILESFLRRTSIYHNAIFQQSYEAQARDNLARSIKRLKSQV